MTDTVPVSTRRRIEPRASRHSAFVCDWRLGRHTLVVVCRTLTAFCVTVATSCELVAIVDRDGQGINSAGARTPHEPLSFVPMSATWLMGCVSFGCAGCLLPSYAPAMGDGWCGSCASGLLSCVSCCSSIEFVVAVVDALYIPCAFVYAFSDLLKGRDWLWGGWRHQNDPYCLGPPTS